MFIYSFTDGTEVTTQKGLPIREVTKLQAEHGTLVIVKEKKDGRGNND